MKLNEFQKRFKNLDNYKLLKIIAEAENYQPIAVEAAEQELSKRNLSEDEVQLIKDKITRNKVKIEERNERFKEIEGKARAIGAELLEIAGPIQKEPQTIDRKVNLIVIGFGLLAISQIIKELGMIQYMFTDSLSAWDFIMVLYFLPLILLVIGVFLFWKRNKIGWVLMSAYLVYIIVNVTTIIFLKWKWNRENEFTNDLLSEDFLIELYEIERLFSQPYLVLYLLFIVIFGVSLWVLCREDIRNEFRIDIKSAWLTVGITILISTVLMSFFW